MKLSSKISLLFTLIVTGILLVMTVMIYNISRQRVQNEFEQRLENRAARTAYLFKIFRQDTTNLLKTLDANAPPQLFDKSILIYGPFNELLYEFHDNDTSSYFPKNTLVEATRNGETMFYREGRKDICLYHNTTSNDDFVVVIAADNVSGREYINDLKNLFSVFLPGAVLLTLLAGFLFSRSIVKPIKETIRDAQLITSQNLSTRLFVGKRKDELADLNATFNELLNRLEESFAIQRRFISNASHELATPLTSVSSQIEVALLQDRSNEQYRQVLKSVMEDVQELHHLTKNLLEIAKAGTHGTISLGKIRLDEVLVKAHGEVLKQYPEYNIQLEFPDLPEEENECSVYGNTHLLGSAFKNIMENGCKYSPDKTVQVRLEFQGYEAKLTFTNKSDTLSKEEIERLFEPFYRSSNAEGKSGVGLGLTLTQRIIRLHKGEITTTSDAEHGTVFTILLPTLKK